MPGSATGVKQHFLAGLALLRVEHPAIELHQPFGDFRSVNIDIVQTDYIVVILPVERGNLLIGIQVGAIRSLDINIGVDVGQNGV